MGIGKMEVRDLLVQDYTRTSVDSFTILTLLLILSLITKHHLKHTLRV